MAGIVVTVMNMKGGVGKTTVVANLAPTIAFRKYGGCQRHVLMIDYDAQFNLSQSWLSGPALTACWEADQTSLAILQDRAGRSPFEIRDPGQLPPPPVADIAVQVWHSEKASLSLVPSTMDLMYVALGKEGSAARSVERRFQTFIDLARREYDLIVIDCHPAGSLLTRTALLSADHLLIPVTDHPFAARGTRLMRDFIGKVRAETELPYHILFNLDAPSARPSAAEREIRADTRLKNRCLKSRLRRWTGLRRLREGSDWIGETGGPYSTKCWNNLVSVADEFSERIGLGVHT